MKHHGFTLRMPGGSIAAVRMPFELAKALTKGNVERLQQPIDVEAMHADMVGFWLFLAPAIDVVSQCVYRYMPEHFPQFIADQIKAGATQAQLQTKDTQQALAILAKFDDWSAIKQAEVFERDILAGKITFADAKEINPKAFRVPSFQAMLAQHYFSGMPAGKKGKRKTHSPTVLELYAVACRIYRENPEISFETACMDAVEQRPDLVPVSWRNDPAGNLKRESIRTWDKSIHSQKSWREDRDK